MTRILLIGSVVLSLAAISRPALAQCDDDHGATAASSRPDLIDTARKAGMFGTLLAALEAAQLADVLRGDGPFTVFAPTDDAFARLGKATIRDLLKPKNRAQLVQVLKNHVVSGRVDAQAAIRAGRAHTLAGAALRFRIVDGRAIAGRARLVKTDLDTANGVIHVVDRVLLP